MTEQDILGFNPQDLFSTNESNQSQSGGSNGLIYRTRPQDSVSEDGIYRAKIKIIYNPENPRKSILEQQSYGLQDAQGSFTVISSLTVDDKSCPIFTSWKKCHYAQEGTALYNQALSKDKGGKGLYDRRFARYVIVQILKDKNQPELVGSFKLWKLPMSIYNLIQQKMNPSKESGKTSIPVMDYLFGRAFNLEVLPGPDDKNNPLRKTREVTYQGEFTDDVVSCINPDGSPILNDDEQDILDAYVNKMNKVWRMVCEDDDEIQQRNNMIAKIQQSEEYKNLVPVYAKVLNQIKEWAPKLDTLSYKEWTPEVKARVENWIKIVESGNDPATAAAAPTEIINEVKEKDDPLDTVGLVSAAEEVANKAKSSVDVSTDDLPF
jgi:hypothetical protein